MFSEKIFFKAVPYSEAKNYNVVIDVSSYAAKPFKLFSPFTSSSDFKIPVPGMKGEFSNSVEGIWQGLKLIDGEIDRSLFISRPHKRARGTYQGHLFENKLVDIVEAREKIYEPSYFYYLDHYVPYADLKLPFYIAALESKEPLLLRDVENNLNPNNPYEAVAHSYYLAKYLNKTLNTFARSVFDTFTDAYKPAHRGESLAGPLSRGEKIKKDFSFDIFKSSLLSYVFDMGEKNASDEFEKRYFEKLKWD